MATGKVAPVVCVSTNWHNCLISGVIQRESGHLQLDHYMNNEA